MNKMKSQTRNRLLLLLLVAGLSGLLYLMPMDYPLPGFIMKLRLQKLLAYLLVAIAGSLATISFQAQDYSPHGQFIWYRTFPRTADGHVLQSAFKQSQRIVF